MARCTQCSVASASQKGEALEAARWDAARTAFEAAPAEDETPDALDGLGLALWFLGNEKEGIAARERAVEGYATARRCDEAARIGIWVSHQHLIAGRASAASGWLARTERAVEGAGPCARQGWVAVERARHAASVEECAEPAQRAMQIGRDADAGDLEVFALSLLGRTEVRAGRTQHGMALLEEEAMAAASAGRVRDVHTLGEANCNLITACTSAGEWERATEWCEAVDDFAVEHVTTPLLGACRTVHADVLLATGRWADAEAAPGERARSPCPVRAADGCADDRDDGRAARAPGPPARGRAAARRRSIRSPCARWRTCASRRTNRASRRRCSSAGCSPPRATRCARWRCWHRSWDARLACGEIAAAEAAAERLTELAADSGITVVSARANLAAARAALARERSADAAEPARRALAEFSRLAMPLEMGEARVELARALAHDAPGLAREEARCALATFRDLGASRAMDVAAAALRDLDSGTAGRPRTGGELTAREQEVLELLGLGMSNAKIAAALFITEKTAGHHVSRILAKLGVRNRTEAASHASRANRPPRAGAHIGSG